MNFESKDNSQMNAVGNLENSGSGNVWFGTKNVNIQNTRLAAAATTLDESVPPLTGWQPRPEQETIAQWFAQPNTCLVGIHGAGGFGKSALAAKVYGEATGFDGKLWANFQMPKPFGTFALWLIEKAMGAERYAQVREVYERNSDEDLLAQALNQLAGKRWLLVMDNVEALLAEPTGELYRQFWAAWLGREGSSVLLLTTQEKVTLPAAERREWLPLTGLGVDAGVALLRGEPFQIAGDEADLRAFVEAADGHPLLLRLAASWLVARAKDDGETAEIYRLRRDDVTLLREIVGQHRGDAAASVGKVLDESFGRLRDEWRVLLARTSVLRGRVTLAVAQAMVAEVTLPELRELARRSFWQEWRLGEAWEFEVLPLIRRYLGLQAGEMGQVEVAHQRAIEYFQTAIVPWDGTLESCDAELELFYHHCELGQFGAAYDVLDTRVEVLDRRGYYRQLVPLYERLTQEWQAQTPEEEKNLGWAWTRLGGLYHDLGQYPSAITAHEQAQGIFRTLDYPKGIAASLGSLGNAYNSLGQYQLAIDFHQQSLEIKRQIGDLGGDANSLGNLGIAYHSLGQYQRAINFHQQCLEIMRKIGDRRGEAKSLGSLGNAYQSLGKHQEAIDFHQQSLEIDRQIGDRRGEAISLMNLGAAYHSLGEYQQAIDFHQQSLEIARQIGNLRGEAASLGSLGNAYHSLGQYQRAIDFHQQSLEIKRQIGDRHGEANSLGNLGAAYQSGQYQQAINFHQQCLEIMRHIGDRNGEATSLFNQAIALAKLDQHWEALQSFQHAKQIFEELQLAHLVEKCNTAIAECNPIIATPSPRRSQSPPLWLFFCMGLAVVFLVWWLQQ
jgi:tetratricopeptide (TPR) repeat protein